MGVSCSSAGLQIVNNFSDAFDLNNVSEENMSIMRDVSSNFDVVLRLLCNGLGRKVHGVGCDGR